MTVLNSIYVFHSKSQPFFIQQQINGWAYSYIDVNQLSTLPSFFFNNDVYTISATFFIHIAYRHVFHILMPVDKGFIHICESCG